MSPIGRRRGAWLVGLGVLVALAFAVSAMLREPHDLAARIGRPVLRAPANGAPVPDLRVTVDTPARPQRTAPSVRGVVRLPSGEPAIGATVTVLRATSAWPEWRAERLDQAITGRTGTFQFAFEDVPGLLVGFEHPQFAGGLVEVPLAGEAMDLRLEPAFELSGVVTNDVGAPVANARVALESVPGEQRRVEVRTTTADGRYTFTNLRGGAARLVARHESWQPVVWPAVVIGDQPRIDLRFERPTMTPLQGRVVSAVGTKPVGGALVQLLPLNSKLGLVDPISVLTDADGAFLVPGLARGNMRLLVRHPEHGSLVSTQSVGIVAADLLLELPPRSAVAGQLVVDRGEPPWRGGERLQLRDAAGQLDHATVDADGRFRFAARFSPGWASVQLLDRRFAFLRSSTVEIDVRIQETATTELELEVAPATVVRGRIVDETGAPLAGAELLRTRFLADSARSIGDAAFQLDLTNLGSQVAQLFGTDRDVPLATSGPDGRFEILGVKPGALLLRTQLPGRGSRLLRTAVLSLGAPGDLGDVVLPRGCRLQGRVLRGDRPLAGATVLVVGRETQAVAITDGAGAWAVDDLMPGTYQVRARLPSQPSGSVVRSITVAPTAPATNHVLVLDSRPTVRGVVTGSEGQAVSGAIVTVRGALGATTVSDQNGEFVLELPERAGELQVSLADRSRSTVLAVPDGDQRLSVRLDTPPTCTLRAQVVGLPGRTPLPAAVLRLTSLDGEAEGETRSRWIALADGELRWALCPAGRVRIEVWADGHAPFVLERELAANREHALGEVLLEPGSRLSGIVRDQDGDPVANAVVLLGEETDLDLFEPRTRTAADGSFRIGGITSRSAQLVVRATGFAARTVELRLPHDVLGAAPLVVTLERGATIAVAVERTLIRDGGLVQLRRGGRVVATAELDDYGRAWFSNRSAGTYTVQLVGGDRLVRTVLVDGSREVVPVRLP